MSDATITTRDKIIGVLTMGAILALLLFAVYQGIQWLNARDVAWERAEKQACVDRGGKVVEYVGGIARFACEGPSAFR
jgi:hypothetical protein